MTVNILLIGIGGNVTQGILTALRKSDRKYNIVGACLNEEAIGLYMVDKAYICPKSTQNNFIEWVINICNIEKIDIIFSGVEEVILKLAKNIDVINKETKAKFISSSYEQLIVGNNKLNTSIWLKENKLNYPKFADMGCELEINELIKSVGFPLIAKPKNGKGSNGIHILSFQEEIDNIENKKDYILQEYLGNENTEYTVGCYSNKYGEMQDIIIMKRELKYGTTFKAEIVQDEDIYIEVKKICEKFKPVGPLNIQLRKHNLIPVCFELNVRFSGTTPMRANWGYNDVEAMVKEYILNEDISGILKPRVNGKAYRCFTEFYIDLSIERDLIKYKHSEGNI